MLPSAIPVEVAAVPAVVRFARKAPRKTPGQIQYPSARKAASAIPVGGYTGLALA